MKVMIKIPFVFVLLFMIVSCATTQSTAPEEPSNLPEKYRLDDELEPVEKIFTIREPRWQEVDEQSIILRADRRDYYLFVLRRPMDKMYSNPRIALSNKSNVTPGIDRVYVHPSVNRQGYVIEKIYRLKGREQAEEIKERFRED